tara:strand:+ start:102 stop:1637 length:1536 start_codon:yes stop_codon:yes gene_type:complete
MVNEVRDKKEIDELIAKKDLSNQDFSDENFDGKDFRDCNLSNSDFTDATFRDANLKNTNLSNSIFTDADLRKSNLKNSDLSNSKLIGADCSDANFSNAKLNNSNLTDANLNGSIFRGTLLENVDFTDAKFDEETNFKDALIKNTKIPDSAYEESKFNREDTREWRKKQLEKDGPETYPGQFDEVVDMSIEELEKANEESKILNEYLKKSLQLKKDGNFLELLNICEQYRKKIPNKIAILQDKAFAMYMSRRYNDALIEYHKVIEVMPHDYEAYDGAGTSYFMQEDFQHALPYLEKALELGGPEQLRESINLCISEVGNNVESVETLIKKFNQRGSRPSDNVTIVDDNVPRAMKVGATATAGYGFEQLIENASVFHAIMFAQLLMQEKSTLDDFRKLKWSGPVFEEQYDEKKLIHELERFTEEKYIEITKTGRWGKKKTVAYKLTSIGSDLGIQLTLKAQSRLKDKIRKYHLSLSPESRQQLHRKLIENGTPCSACPTTSGVNSSGALPMDV